MTGRRTVKTTAPPSSATVRSRGGGLTEVAFTCLGPPTDYGGTNPTISARWASPAKPLTITGLRVWEGFNIYHDILMTLKAKTGGVVASFGLIRVPMIDQFGNVGEFWLRAATDLAVPPLSTVWVESYYDEASFLDDNEMATAFPDDATFAGGLGDWTATDGASLTWDPTSSPHADVGHVMVVHPAGSAAGAEILHGTEFDSQGCVGIYGTNQFPYLYIQSLWFRSEGTVARPVTLTTTAWDGITTTTPLGSATATIPGDGAWHQVRWTTIIDNQFSQPFYNYAYLLPSFSIDTSADGSAMDVSDLFMGYRQEGQIGSGQTSFVAIAELS